MTPAAGITRVFLGRRRAGLSPQAARAHWRTVHAPIAAEIPGALRYVQNHAVEETPATYCGFDICMEMAFESADAMEAGFAHAVQLGAEEDEANFLDPARSVLFVGRRDAWPPDDEGREGVVKTLLLARAYHRTADAAAELASELRAGGWNDVVAGVDGFETPYHLVADDELRRRFGPFGVDAVLVAYSDADTAAAPAAAFELRDAVHSRLSVFGLETLVAQPFVVVS